MKQKQKSKRHPTGVKQPQQQQQRQRHDSGTAVGTSTNCPKNHLIKDATTPFEFKYTQFGSSHSVCVHQSPCDDTWPGGALWDLGVLMAQILVSINNGRVPKTKPVARLRPSDLCGKKTFKDLRTLELGCGVGLTGLVAASLGARATLLTDLEVVIGQVTHPNVERNATKAKGCVNYYVTRSGGRIAAVPLCWGDEKDEHSATNALKDMSGPRKSRSCQSSTEEYPDLILIGDVAYQHKPGAPSHFEALLSTVLRIAGEETVIMFGTRMRMPASGDLLDLFYEHFDDFVNPPIEAHEVDPSYESQELGRKHNMAIHIFKKKQGQRTSNLSEK